MPQECYMHVTGPLRTLNVQLTHAWGMLQKHTVNLRPKAMDNPNPVNGLNMEVGNA